MDEAYEYLSLNNNQNSTFNGLKRIDHQDYPPEAIREALLNAVVQRDYDYSGNSIINIYEDRMEFISIGGLVKGITIADTMNGVSQPRNSIFADVFYRLKLIESCGIGIRKIFESFAATKQKPVINHAPASFIISLPKLKVHDRVISRDEQQHEVLGLIDTRGEISRKDVETSLSVPKHTAVKLPNELLIEKKIQKSGRAKAACYYIRQSIIFNIFNL